MMGFITTICRNRWQLSRVMEILVTRKSGWRKRFRWTISCKMWRILGCPVRMLRIRMTGNQESRDNWQTQVLLENDHGIFKYKWLL